MLTLNNGKIFDNYGRRKDLQGLLPMQEKSRPKRSHYSYNPSGAYFIRAFALRERIKQAVQLQGVHDVR